MTLPPVIRIFFAIDLPETHKEEIGLFIGGLKKKSKSHGIRWTKPENLHITLQFLAEAHTENLEALLKNVRKHVEGKIKNVSFHFGELQLFPNPYRPRVIVLTIEPQEHLRQLSSLIGQGIQATQYPLEARPFKAHLTLGRIKYMQGVNLNFLTGETLLSKEGINIFEVVLFRSEPLPEGSHYTILDKIQLTELLEQS